MKNIKHILTILAVVALLYGCDQGIDPISEVAPGADASAPAVKINYPVEGTTIKVLEIITAITIDFEVTDDIEVASITVNLDGKNIGNYNDFVDYRRVLIDDLTYDQLKDGAHILNVTANDLDGKSTSVSVNFAKEPAYTPLFANETLYMPFDGDFNDLVGLSPAMKIGEPGFAGEALIGTNSYQGTPDAYLTVPTDGLLGTEFTAAFWYKVNSDPDRAGILVVGDNADDRFQGFRLFREGNADEQRIKANVGLGTGDSWNDGDVLNVADGEWVHIAFTISATQSKIFFNGEEVNSADLAGPVDWTNCDLITIGSGGPTFDYWNHKSDSSPMDELRLFDKALTAEEIQNMIAVTNPYEGEFDGEMFYVPFNGSNKDWFTNAEATVVGTTGFAGESVRGSDAFAGAPDSYLTFPAQSLNTEEFSATLWYKLNAEPGRGGILVMGPEDTENPEYPIKQNFRDYGFRFFREGDATRQIFKLNVGTGSGNEWADGGDAAALNPATATDWVHLAFTISGSKAKVYIEGEMVAEKDISGIDWTGSDLLSIGSGAPRFTGWNHLSDESFVDELRLYNKALTQEEIQTVRNADL